MARKSSGFNAWSGWVAFAAFTLLTLGVINLFMGLTALLKDGYFVTATGTTSADLLVWSYTTWGVILLVFAGLQFLTGMGLLAGQAWARFVAIALAVLNIIGHIGFVDARPVWSVVVMALDLVVLYALTARWQEARGIDRPMSQAEEAEWRSGAPARRQTTGGSDPERPEGGSRMGPA